MDPGDRFRSPAGGPGDPTAPVGARADVATPPEGATPSERDTPSEGATLLVAVSSAAESPETMET